MPIYVPGKVVLAQTYVGIDDPDAAAYITAVEAADTAAGQSGGLETATKVAIHSFVKGCKADGIWPAIKASCILAGARTLTGALIPLVGTAPTNVNFVSGDYNRKTGLVGDGSTKYLNSNRNNNADPQNSQHLSAYVTEQPNPTGSVSYIYLGTNFNLTGSSLIGRSGTAARLMSVQMRYGANFVVTDTSAVTGFFGASIGSSSSFSVRYNNTSNSQVSTSATPRNENIDVFRAGGGGLNAPNRIAFYSIGESLGLALLDARVTDLINAFAAAIP
jgi:hypothetical protein